VRNLSWRSHSGDPDTILKKQNVGGEMKQDIYRRIAKRWPIKTVLRRYYGQTVFLPRASYSDIALRCLGEYEPDNCKILVQLALPKTMMLDVGTNFGLTSIPVLVNCPEVKVLSFEPSPIALKFLRRTMRNVSFKDRWELIEQCAGAEVGATEFTLSEETTAEFDGIRHTKRVQSHEMRQVPMTTIDAEWKRRAYPEVSVIKCDVEGAEIAVLHGAVECINRTRPYILMEWNRINIQAYNFTSSDLIGVVEQFDYEIYALPGMIRVANCVEVDLQALVTESLLLAPRKRPPVSQRAQ